MPKTKKDPKDKEIERLKVLLAETTKRRAVVRQVNMDRMMRVDSNLNRMVLDACINARRHHSLHPDLYPDHQYCPIDDMVIRFMSEYLRHLYVKKEMGLRKELNFKQDDQWK